MRKLKVAVVGCGFVAQRRHIPAFLRLKKDVSLCAVCDLNYSLAKNVANKFGIPNAYSNISKLIKMEHPDIVDICTPPKTHASVAVEAMENGCHVLVEKPMASTLSDCDRMIEASNRNGVKLSIVHNQRFYPAFLKAEELVKRGIIGKLTGINIISLTPREEYLIHENHWIHKLPGGIISETGPHVIYMSLAFMNNIKDVSVSARKVSDYPWVLYDDYRIELKGENVTSSIIVSHANSYTANEIELLGTEYMLKVDLQNMLVVRYRRTNLNPVNIAISSFNTVLQELKGITLNTIKVLLRRPMLGHDIMIKKFVKALVNDEPLPVTPEEGRETVRIMEMIIQKLL